MCELTGSRTSDTVAHGSSVTPSSGKDLLLFNTEVLLGKVEHLISELDVLATLVGPASVETVGGNEDGGVGSETLKTVEATLGNVVHVAITPVVAKDKSVGLVGVVVPGNLEDELTVLAVDLHVLGAALGRSFATAS